MAYNPYSAVNAIYKLKGQWDSANNAGDTATKDSVAAKAQQYYKQLRSNGYGDIADQLTASNYTQAKAINDKWAKMGKTSTRDYLYTLGQSKGMSQSDVDKLISWDNQTGEVSFGGKKIGTPDSVVDGVSYWSDTSVLDNAFNDYIGRSGTVRSKSTAVNQENEKLFEKYNQEYEDLKKENPFETETGKAILAKYDLAGLQGRDNEVASGAGSNGGNIDSFAAANALRQQSSLVRQGQAVALDAHQQKLDHARALLSDMGVNIERVFNEDETSKNNDVARKSEIASVSGYTPDEWTASSNPYLNDDGTIKDEYKDVDFAAVMANAKAAGNTEAYNAAAVARYYKIMGNYGAYGQYDDGNYVVPGLKQTEAARQFDEQIAASDRALNAETSMNAANNQNKIDQITTSAKYGTTVNKSGTVTATKPTLTAAQATNAIKNGEISQSVIDAYNYYYGTSYTVDNPPKVDGGKTGGVDLLTGGDSSSATPETDYQANLDKVYSGSSKTVQDYIRNKLEPLITENSITETELKEHLIANSKDYDLETKDIKAICTALGVDSKWVDNYKNSGLFGWGSGVKER